MKPRKKSILDILLPLVGILVVLFFAMHMAVAYECVKDDPIIHQYKNTDGEIVERKTLNINEFVKCFSQEIGENKFQFKWVASTPKFLFFAAVFCLFVAIWIDTDKKKLIQSEMYGSAVWGKLSKLKSLLAQNIGKKEIMKVRIKHFFIFFPKRQQILINNIRNKYCESSNVIFTQDIKICRYNYKLNDNTIILGGSGSKKTTSYAIPNILQLSDSEYSPSIVATDPKGDIVEMAGHYLVDIIHYPLKVLNLKELDRSFCFNPFVYIQEKKFEGQIKHLVHVIVKSRLEKDEAKVNDPFWDNMAELLLCACFYAVYEGFPKEEQTIITAIQLFRWFEVSDDDDREQNPTKLDDFFEVFGNDKAILEKYGDLNENPALRCWEDFRTKCKGKTAQSVTATALEKISPFDEKEIRRIFSKDELSLDRVGEKRMALFVVLPPTNKDYNFIANIMYTQLFEQLEYCATVKHNQKLSVPVKFILDEFYNTGKLPNFVNILSYARAFGVGITLVIQSLEQLKELYEKSWGTIIDNTSTMLYLGRIRHEDTLKYISSLLGKGTYDKKSISQTKGSQSSTQISYDKVGRELMDTSEVQKLPDDDCLFFPMGFDPFYCKKYDLSHHPNYKYTSRADSKNSFKYKLLDEEKVADIKIPHGEENKSKEELILLNLNQKEVVSLLEHNILFLDIDDDNSVSVNEQEKEDINLLASILDEKENINNESETLSAVIAKMADEIILTMDSLSVVKTMSNLIENKENIEVESSDNQSKESDEEEFELDDDILQSIESINIAVDNLQNDLISEGFLEDIQQYDIGKMQSSEKSILDFENEEEKEEEEDDEDEGWVASWVQKLEEQ